MNNPKGQTMTRSFDPLAYLDEDEDARTPMELVTHSVTLDGRPATISGSSNDFAVIRSLDGKMSGEWSWHATNRIVASGGDFRL